MPDSGAAPIFVMDSTELTAFESQLDIDLPFPRKTLSCSSPTGDWLHVEYWDFDESRMLVKMPTDWH